MGSEPSSGRQRGSRLPPRCSYETVSELAVDGRDNGEQLGVVGELAGVLEGQSRGSRPVAGDDERGDLDDLALPSGGGARLLLRSGDVVGGRGGVAATRPP